MMLVMCGALLAQQVTRDAAGRVPQGTAVVEGVILSDEPNGRPLRRVTVRLVPGIAERYTTTDDDGRFIFTELPAGRYYGLWASRPGFLNTQYGQKRIGGAGGPVVLSEGQRLNVVLKMARASVITGTVLDQGRPARADVIAMRVRTMNGQRTLVASNNGRAATDARGVYRLSELEPGEYIISATPTTMFMGMSGDGELRTVSPEEIKWAQMQLQGSTTSAAALAPKAADPAPPAGPAVAFAAAYYPAGTDISRAATVTVGVAEEKSGVDFTLQTVRTARISGTVLDQDGQPAQEVEIGIAAQSELAGSAAESFRSELTRRLRPRIANGTFVVDAMNPGNYTITARAAARGGAGTKRLWASVDIAIAGADQTVMVLRLEPGVTLSGTLTFEKTPVTPEGPRPGASVRVIPMPDASGRIVDVGVPAASVQADGSFTLEGVPPGFYLLRGGAPVARPPTWQTKSARVGDIDATDHPFEVRRSENITGITVVLTNGTAEVTGTLVDAAGQPAPGLTVLLFPTDSAMWSSRSSRFPRTSRTGSDGKFGFRDLLGGSWYLAAFEDFDGNDVYNSEFLAKTVPAAATVTLADGEKKVQDLKIR